MIKPSAKNWKCKLSLLPSSYFTAEAFKINPKLSSSSDIHYVHCIKTPVLQQLHWFVVVRLIKYRILLLTFKALHGCRILAIHINITWMEKLKIQQPIMLHTLHAYRQQWGFYSHAERLVHYPVRFTSVQCVQSKKIIFWFWFGWPITVNVQIYRRSVQGWVWHSDFLY